MLFMNPAIDKPSHERLATAPVVMRTGFSWIVRSAGPQKRAILMGIKAEGTTTPLIVKHAMGAARR
jgi:hypothetical protein